MDRICRRHLSNCWEGHIYRGVLSRWFNALSRGLSLIFLVQNLALAFNHASLGAVNLWWRRSPGPRLSSNAEDAFKSTPSEIGALSAKELTVSNEKLDHTDDADSASNLLADLLTSTASESDDVGADDITASGDERGWHSHVEGFFNEFDELAATPAIDIFNADIKTCSENGDWKRAVSLLDEMRAAIVTPDMLSFDTAIAVCEEKDRQWQQMLSHLEEIREMEENKDDEEDLFGPRKLNFDELISACDKVIHVCYHQDMKWQQLVSLLDDIRYQAVLSTADRIEDLDIVQNIHYVNLAARADRRARIEEQLEELGLNASRFDACNGSSVNTTIIGHNWTIGLHALFDRDRRMHLNQTHVLSEGERGCAGSHVALWEKCVSENRPIMVLEDDARFDEDFKKNFPLVFMHVAEHNPTLLFLQSNVGSIGKYHKELAPKLSIVEVKYSWETGGYVLWPKTAAKLLKHLPMNEPVDNFIARLNYLGEIRSYATMPPIVYQFNTDLADTTVIKRSGRSIPWLHGLNVTGMPPEMITYGAPLLTAISSCEECGQWQRALSLLKKLDVLGLTEDEFVPSGPGMQRKTYRDLLY